MNPWIKDLQIVFSCKCHHPIKPVWDDREGLFAALEDLRHDLDISRGEEWEEELEEAVRLVEARIKEMEVTK